MVEQKLCPNCGSVMDLSNVFISGKAVCPNCGYQGMPTDRFVKEPKAGRAAQKELKLPPKEEQGPPPDPLDLPGLSLKLAIVMGGMLVLAVATPGFKALLPVAVLGILIFGGAYLVLTRK